MLYLGPAWTLHVPSRNEPRQDLPLPPALPHHCSAVSGGTSQIRRNNGQGRGQVRLRAHHRARGRGHRQQDCEYTSRGGRAANSISFPSSGGVPAEPSAPFLDEFPLRPRHFNFVPARRLALSLRRKPPGHAPLQQLLLPRPCRSETRGILRAPNFPHLGPTILASLSPLLAKAMIYSPGIQELPLLFPPLPGPVSLLTLPPPTF